MKKHLSYLPTFLLILGLGSPAQSTFGDIADLTPYNYEPNLAIGGILDEVRTNNVSDALDYLQSVNPAMTPDQFETAFQGLRLIYEGYTNPETRRAALLAVLASNATLPTPAPSLSDGHREAIKALFSSFPRPALVIKEGW